MVLFRPTVTRRLVRFAHTYEQFGRRYLSTESKGAKTQRSGPERHEEAKPVQTATTMFMLANPELYLDPRKGSTMKLIAAVWVFFGGYIGYLVYEEREEEKNKVRQMVGPLPPDVSRD